MSPLRAVPSPAGQVVSFPDELERQRQRKQRRAQRQQFHAELARLSGTARVMPLEPVQDAEEGAEFSPEVQVLIWERAGGECELRGFRAIDCWGPLGFHHRKAKGSGGSRDGELGRASNGLLPCAAHHVNWIHAHPGAAGDLGLLLSKAPRIRPAQERVSFDGGLTWWYLTDDGGKVAAGPPPGGSALVAAA